MSALPAPFHFGGRLAIVTGGGVSPGRVPSIGEATARLLAARGAQVAVVDVDRDAAEETARRIAADGGTAIAIAADLAHEDECARAVAEATGRDRILSVLVNNVGIGSGSVVTTLVEDEFDRAVAINLKSAMFMAKHAIPAFRDGGSIVNLSSTAVQYPTASLAYSATKAALEAVTQHIAFQYGPDRIRCNAVRPGEVWTAMVDRNCKTEEDAARLRQDRARRCLLPYDGDAWDLASLVAFLASDEARWITGQVISVDGGAALIRPNPDWQAHHSYHKATRPR